MHWPPDLNALSAWAAAAAVAVAIIALAVQVRQGAFNSSLDSLWHLEERFNGLGRERSVAARYLRPPGITGFRHDDAAAPRELDDVLDFFSLIGYLVSAGAIRKEAAWMNWSAWAVPYWFASEAHVVERRRVNPLYWRHYEELVETMQRIETKRLLVFDDTIRLLAWMPRRVRSVVSLAHGFVSPGWVAKREWSEYLRTISEEAAQLTSATSPVTAQPILPN